MPGRWTFFHALLATLLIHLSRYLNEWLILYDFDNNREVVGEKNIAVAIVEGRPIWPAPTWSAARLRLGKRLVACHRVVSDRPDPFNRACRFALPDLRARHREALTVIISRSVFLSAVSSCRRHGERRRHQRSLERLAAGSDNGRHLCFLLVDFNGSDPFHHGAVGVSLLLGSALKLSEQRNIGAALFKAVIFLSITLAYIRG